MPSFSAYANFVLLGDRGLTRQNKFACKCANFVLFGDRTPSGSARRVDPASQLARRVFAAEREPSDAH
jgi:hypothetical protein